MRQVDRRILAVVAILLLVAAFWLGGVAGVVVVIVAGLLYPLRRFLALRDYYTRNGEHQRIIDDLREAYRLWLPRRDNPPRKH